MGYTGGKWPFGFGEVIRNMGCAPWSDWRVRYHGRRFAQSLKLVTLCFLTGAGTASATEHELNAYGHVLSACYQASTDRTAREACIGQMAQVCMDSQDGGHTTLGMSSCLSAEAAAWDRFLNAEYKATMTVLKAMDDDEAIHFPEYAKRVENLRAAQRAWIPFRDAECNLAYAEWGSGSMRSIAFADCMSDMTARRTLDLRDMRERFE